MEYKLKIGEKEFELSVSKKNDGGLLRVEIGDDAYEVEIGASVPGRHSVTIGGRNEKLVAAGDIDGIWVWSKGRGWLVKDAEKESRRGGGSIEGQWIKEVTPATPGVVVRILVEVGEEVKKGRELVVVSAMKMESPLVAGYDGTVSAINTELGANVRPGEILVEIDEKEEG